MANSIWSKQNKCVLKLAKKQKKQKEDWRSIALQSSGFFKFWISLKQFKVFYTERESFHKHS